MILWEIAAGKLDFAASEKQRHRSDCDDVKPACLSVEIVSDNPTSGKISIPQLVSVAEQTGLSLAWSHVTSSVDPEVGTGGPDPSGKSQVIWVSIGNKQLDPLPPPLEKVEREEERGEGRRRKGW